MYRGACFILGLMLVVPALCQVAPEAEGGTESSSQMATPPPMSDQSYPTEVGSEARSNYLRAGLSFSTSYIDNLYAGSSYSDGSSKTPAETIYSVWPTIAYDQTTPRQHRVFTYSPGFTFYEPTNALNESDQDLKAEYLYRMTEHLTVNASDSFQQSSASSGLGSLAGGGVSGSTQPVTPGIFAPFAERLTNTADAQLAYQFSPVGMIAVSGTWMKLNYPNPTEVTGLYNSDNRSVSGSYSRRMSATQYIGANYQFAWVFAYPQDAGEVDTKAQTIYGFYTIYPNKNLSISVSGGPQYYSASEKSVPTSSGWAPIVIASAGWQGLHTNFAASYTREVTAGGGLLGVYNSNSADAQARWQISHTWTTGASAKYTINKSATPIAAFAAENGHAILGSATLDHSFNEQFNLQFEYDRLHQSYSGIAGISGNPNSNRETISLVWRFTRPLGR